MSAILWRITRNSSIIFFGKLTNLVINFVVFILLANHFGPELFGRFTFALVFIAFFDSISNFGINQIILREISKEKDSTDWILSHGFFLKFSVSFLAFVFSSLSIIFFDYPSEVIWLVWIFSLNFFIGTKVSSFRTFFDIIFQRDLKMNWPVFFSVVDNSLFLLLILIGFYFNVNLKLFALFYTIANLPGFLLLAKQFFSKVNIHLNIKKEFLIHLLKEMLPVFLFVTFSIFLTRIDVFLLSRFYSETEVGLYNAVVRLILPLLFLQIAISLSLFPLLSSYYKKNLLEFKALAVAGFNVLFVISMCIGSMLIGKSDFIIQLIYKPEYIESASVMPYFGYSIPFMFLLYYGVDLLLSIEKQKCSTWSLVIALIVNLVLNLVLIPTHSFVGSGIAKLISYILATTLIFSFFHFQVKIFSFKVFIKYIIFIMIVFFYSNLFSNLNIVLFLILSLICIFLMVFIFRLIDFKYLKFIKRKILTEN